MNQLTRAVMKWMNLVENPLMNRRLNASCFSIPRLFSAEASETTLGSSDDNFIKIPTSGFVYGKLSNTITTHTSKSDIINLLRGCNLKPENIRFQYTRLYMPLSVMIEFPSRASFDMAFKAIQSKGNLYNLARGDKSQFDLIAPYDGKALILRGLPRVATADDIERFLSGCQYYSSSMEISLSAVNARNIRKIAIVRFPSQALAFHAFISKNKGFCLNDKITLQLLH